MKRKRLPCFSCKWFQKKPIRRTTARHYFRIGYTEAYGPTTLFVSDAQKDGYSKRPCCRACAVPVPFVD